MVLFLMAFVVGEGPPPVWRFTQRELVTFFGMALLFGGLAVAWFRDVWGGVATLGGWLLLWIVMRRVPADWPLLIPALTGAAHVICGLALRGTPPPGVGGPLSATAKAAATGAGACLLVFVLLAANEMFGQPPLMTAHGPLPAPLVATWASDGVTFTIAADGTATGAAGGAALAEGRVVRNRSWFGSWIDWRTDYALRGTLADGRPVSFLFNLGERDVHGSLSLGRPPKVYPLRLSRQ